MKTHLIIDASNILQRTFFAAWQLDTSDKANTGSLAIHNAITTLNKYFKKFQPNNVICVFDRPNWRKDYTRSDLCLSKKEYKGNRRLNLTPQELMRYQEFLEHITQFEQVIKDHTSIIAMSKERLEADDIIAGLAERFKDDRVIIISADKDLIQTLRFPDTYLIDPATDKLRECDDLDYFIFFKCIRGDRGDNVASAFPRVRETRIQAAYQNDFEYNNLMNETWTNENGIEHRVGDLYEENKLLMDLYNQPGIVKRLIGESIDEGFETRGTFSYFHFVKFCNRHNLIKLRDQVSEFTPLLACGKV